MRSVRVMILAAALGCLLSACATRTTMGTTSPKKLASASECPELEGYPDCQNGHQVYQ
jgi:hypothetical protein